MFFNRNVMSRLKLIKLCQEGSFTVEMSMLFPIILFVIVAMLFFVFYINDLVCIRSVVNRYTVTLDNNRDKTGDEIVNELLEELKDETLIVNIKDIKIDKQRSKTVIRIDINFRFGYWRIDKNNAINVNIHTEDNISFIVKTKVFMDIAKSIKEQ